VQLSLEGYVSKTLAVVGPTRHRQRSVDVELQPVTGEGPATTPVSTGGNCRPNPDLPDGFVTIDTKPYADLYWGDRHLGQTPMSRMKLPSGCLQLKAVTLGEKKSKRVRIQVQPGRVAVYRFTID
jgi:hypothetical protein